MNVQKETKVASTGTATATQLEAINAQAKAKLTAEQVYVFSVRLCDDQIDRDMEELISQLKPDVIAIEELFFNTNITTGIAVAHGRGVLLCAAERSGVPLYEYTPSQVKLAVTGYGKAEKHQVMDMTKRLLKLKAVPRPDDAADALAIAICHARSATSRLPQTDGVKETI